MQKNISSLTQEQQAVAQRLEKVKLEQEEVEQ